jgi:pimeloyl-ACP methyl ester carboxylesterase
VTFDVDAERKSFTTSDGVTLSYLEAGGGQPFIMIPGWSQAAVQWHHQINHFGKSHRVVAVDMRGHGDSEKVDYGYRITRLSKDVRELMEALDLRDVVLMGHSLGCAVIWGLYDLWGADRIQKLILCDESPYLSDNPLLSDQEKRDAGATFTADALWGVCSALSGPNGEATTKEFIANMFTPQCPRDVVDAVIALNLKFPRKQSAALIVNNVYNDWRDLIRRISVPTLVIGGDASVVPTDCARWIAASIPGGCELEIFGADEGGSHFSFMENPAKFNARLDAFLSG